jgi:hypothetical protein
MTGYPYPSLSNPIVSDVRFIFREVIRLRKLGNIVVIRLILIVVQLAVGECLLENLLRLDPTYVAKGMMQHHLRTLVVLFLLPPFMLIPGEVVQYPARIYFSPTG